MSKHRLLSDLRLFDLEKAYCRTDFDREFIHRAIIEWYGSTEAFTHYVRGPLREELMRCNRSAFPLQYLLLVSAVPFSASLDSLVSLSLGGMKWQGVLAEFVGNSIGFHLGFFVALLNFAVYLCDRFAAPICSGMLLDYLQSFMIFVVFFSLYYLGQVVNRLAYTTSLLWAVVWATAAMLSACFSLASSDSARLLQPLTAFSLESNVPFRWLCRACHCFSAQGCMEHSQGRRHQVE